MKTQTDETTPYFENCIHNAEEINDFDYNKMISDFEKSTRHESHLKKIRQRWEREGKRYDQKMRNMKDNREKEYREKNAQLKNKLNKKNQLMITALNEKREAKSAEKQRIIEELMEKENDAKRKVDDFLMELEEKRLKEAVRTEMKIKSFIAKNEQKKRETHDRIHYSLTQNEERFANNYLNLLEKNKEIEKIKEEQAKKKYETFFWHKKEILKKQREKKILIKNKLAAKEDRIKDLEILNNKKRREIQKRIHSMNIKRDEYEKVKYRGVEDDKEKREEMFRKTLENKEKLKIDRDSLREEILTYQNCILARAINKDNLTDLKRTNAHENTVVMQMTLERNVANFVRRMNRVKGNSILKKSKEERLMIFKELKRKEAEKKRKEEEDKQNHI